MSLQIHSSGADGEMNHFIRGLPLSIAIHPIAQLTGMNKTKYSDEIIYRFRMNELAIEHTDDVRAIDVYIVQHAPQEIQWTYLLLKCAKVFRKKLPNVEQNRTHVNVTQHLF